MPFLRAAVLMYSGFQIFEPSKTLPGATALTRMPDTGFAFVAAGSGMPGVPAVIDGGVPNAIAVAWLERWQAHAGGAVVMGYLEISLPVDLLRFFGVSANAAGSGRPVPVSLSEPDRRYR